MDYRIERELFVCACGDVEHQFVVSKFDDEPEFYVSVHLKSGGFFERLRAGLRYIFGKKSIYGDFDEIILTPDGIERLRKTLDKETRPKAE